MGKSRGPASSPKLGARRAGQPGASISPSSLHLGIVLQFSTSRALGALDRALGFTVQQHSPKKAALQPPSLCALHPALNCWILSSGPGNSSRSGHVEANAEAAGHRAPLGRLATRTISGAGPSARGPAGRQRQQMGGGDPSADAAADAGLWGAHFVTLLAATSSTGARAHSGWPFCCPQAETPPANDTADAWTIQELPTGGDEAGLQGAAPPAAEGGWSFVELPVEQPLAPQELLPPLAPPPAAELPAGAAAAVGRAAPKPTGAAPEAEAPQAALAVPEQAAAPQYAAAAAPPRNCWVQSSTDFEGADLLPDGNTTCCASASDCCRECWATPGCGAWTFRGTDVSGRSQSWWCEGLFQKHPCPHCSQPCLCLPCRPRASPSTLPGGCASRASTA